MKLASVWMAALGAVLAVGCSKADSGTSNGPPRPAAGKERGDCVAPKPQPEQPVDEFAVGTCDPGLLCLSNLCVRPPPADCQVIADQLASFDLGNYAEPEERAPVVDKYKRACHKAMVSKEQGECMANATNRFAALQCAPLMFPDTSKQGAAGGGECAPIMDKIKAAMARSMGNAQDPQTNKMLDAVFVAMKDSCEQDGWPPAFKQCILAADDGTDGMTQCNAQMPPDLQQKLTQRMTDVIQQQSPPPGPPRGF